MLRKKPIDSIMIHCTATPAGREVSVTTLDTWHKARNFEPYVREDGTRVYAGYHLLVHLDGSYERIRPDAHRGQHCAKADMNNPPYPSATSEASTSTTSRATHGPRRRSRRC